MTLKLSEWGTELKRLEDAIDQSDNDGLVARWKSGQHMLTQRKGRASVPRGLLDVWSHLLGVHRSELTARMKFAEKFPEEELTNVISKFRTWFDIKQQALTDKPRGRKKEKKTASAILLHAFNAVEGIDALNLTVKDHPVILRFAALINRVRETLWAQQQTDSETVDWLPVEQTDSETVDWLPVGRRDVSPM